jgi:catechol 2,3-dioxygenase
MNFMGDLVQCQVNNGRGIASRARIGHVNLRVTDLDRATDFYREVLGLTVTCYGPTIGLPIVFLAFGDYHHHLALNWFYDDRSDSKPARHGGLNHFAIVHADELSLANAVQRLSMHGGRIEDARDHGSTLSVYLRDPDGNGIELYWDRPRSQWFDATGQLVIKSEPLQIEKWLEEVSARTSETAFNRAISMNWRCCDDRNNDAVSVNSDVPL